MLLSFLKKKNPLELSIALKHVPIGEDTGVQRRKKVIINGRVKTLGKVLKSEGTMGEGFCYCFKDFLKCISTCVGAYGSQKRESYLLELEL